MEEGGEQAILAVLENVQTTNLAILDQVNELAANSEQTCSCTCHNPGSSLQVNQALHDFEERLKDLERYVHAGSNNIPNENKHIHSTDSDEKRQPFTGETRLSNTGDKRLTNTDDKNLNNTGERRREQSKNVKPVTEHKEYARKHTEVKRKEPQHSDTKFPEKQTPKPQTRLNPEPPKMVNFNVNDTNTIPTSSMKFETKRNTECSKTENDSKAHRPHNPSAAHTEHNSSSSEIVIPNVKTVRSQQTEKSTGANATCGLDVEVIHQTEIRSHAKANDWTILAQMELDSGKITKLKTLEGAHTAILLDTSESMAEGDAWTQAKTFLHSFINGLAHVSREHGLTDEHLSFVTFGHETRVVRRLTKQYDEILQAIGSVKLGGPSPLFGGLYMSLAAVMQSKAWDATINDIMIHSKVIVITDGQVTNTFQHGGPDITDDFQENYIKDLDGPVSALQQRGIDIYTVPVGTANKNFTEYMNKNSRQWPWEEGEKLSRRSYLTVVAGSHIMPGLLPLFGAELDPNFKTDVPLTDSDRLHVMDIARERRQRHFNEWLRESKDERDQYLDTENDRLLAVGSRVKRGPDWKEDRDEDKNGPGTVVGHFRFRDKVWVHWDCGDKICNYRYGDETCYDVLAVDDIRTPSSSGQIEVGCIVKPGKHAKEKHPELKPFDRGTVVANLGDRSQLGVKWKNGSSGIYDYIPGIREEVEYSPSTDDKVTVTTTVKEKPDRGKKNKNKNN